MFLSKRAIIGVILAGALAVSASAAFVKTGSYTEGQFTDVPATEWYASEVASAFELGLMNGTGGGLFAPDGDVTVAEAITMASRAAALGAGETIDTATGGEWYTPYVNYAVSKGFVAQGQFDNFDRPAKRYEVAVIFEKAMPEGYFTAQNSVDAIPDVSEKQTYEKELLTLYKAGVVMGSDSYGNFRPEDNITRAEAAAIINRVALPENRLKKTLDKISTDDAYMLVITDQFNNTLEGINSGWLLDNRGGTPRTSITDSYGSLVDISAEAGTAYIREFNKTTTGTLRLTTSLSANGSKDGICLEYRNDEDNPVYRLETIDGSWKLLEADGSYTALYEIGADEKKFSFIIDIDLDNNRSTTCINDTPCGTYPLITSGDKSNLLNFRFATTDKSTAAVSLGATYINVNYAVFEDLEPAKGWIKSDGSADDTLSPNVSAVRSFNPVSGKVIAEMYFLLPKAESITYVLRSGTKELVAFSTDDKNFYANGQKIYENYYANLWYRLRVEADTDSQKAVIKINGRNVGEVPFAEAATSADNLFVSNASETVPTLNSFRVFRKWEREDYVPKPAVPKGEENYTVGMNVCSLWTNGTGSGWSSVTPFDDPHPVLGYYDERNPETADWEIKYLVEHGIDFGAYCVFFNSASGPQNIGRCHLYDGFMNAEYSDMSKFCVIWETANASSPYTVEAWENDYVPYFIENFFKDPRHIVIDNKPVLCVFGAGKIADRLGSNAKVKECFDYLEEEVKKIGFDGMIYLACGSSSNALAEMGFDGCYAYNWGTTGYNLYINKSAVESSAKQGAVYTVPTISVGFNSVPWHGVRYPLMSKGDYAAAQAWVKDEYLPTYAKETWQNNFVMLSTWNEFGEGTYIMPTTDEKGFQYLDVVREAYTDEKADASINTVPTEAQKTRINRLYPQYRHLLRKEGYYSKDTDSVGYQAVEKFECGKIKNLRVTGFEEGYTVTDDGLLGTSKTADPVMIMSDLGDFDLSEVSAVRVTAQVPKGNYMQLFFTTDTSTSWSEEKSKKLDVLTDELAEYIFDFRSNADWNGSLTALRLDPAGKENVTLTVKSIELLAKEEKPSNSLTINGLTFEMNLPYQTAENGDILVAFDPTLAMDFRLNAFHVWDKSTGTLTLCFTKHTLVYTVGSDTYTLDGVKKPLGYKLAAFDGLPLLPIKKLCEDVGYTYSADEKNCVSIDTDQKVFFEEIAKRKVGSYEFNTNGDSEGWTSGSSIFVSEGNLALETATKAKDADPMMFSAAVEMPAGKYNKLHIRMRYRNYAEKKQFLQLFFITDQSAGWSEEKSIRIDLPTNDTNGEWIELLYDLTEKAEWKDTILKFRLDPFNAGGTVDFDYIRFEENPDYVYIAPEDMPFTLENGDAEDVLKPAFKSFGGESGIISDPLDSTNNCYYFLPKDNTSQEWVYAAQKVRFKKGATYRIEGDLRPYSSGLNKDVPDDFSTMIFCNIQYIEPDKTSQDHLVGNVVPKYGNGWMHFSYEFTISPNSRNRGADAVTFFANPKDNLGVGFLLDNVVVTEVSSGKE